MPAATRRIKFSLLLFFLVLTVAAVSAHDANPGPGAESLLEAPPGAASPAGAGSPGDDGGSISAPAGGSDAKSILAGSSHMMGGSDDSTDGKDDASQSPDGQKGDGGNDSHSGGGASHGQCVTACASKSTEGVGCGKDLSKPDCFCKSQDFIQQTFACINATCPQQFHGAAGVVTSICAVAGAPNLTIPGYQGSSNLENMPTVNDDGDQKGSSNTTNSTASTPPPSGSSGAGVTSTFSMPVTQQTPGAPSSSSSSSSAGKNSSGTAAGGASSSSVAASRESAGVVAFVTAAAMVASVGIWTLL
ncbi:uncharacterized protein UTRI_05080 [Ustilago trichophora]|uniref:CFEM domain-containing protein n=1 Tax=Ustilago trichophora TaxID=86804 RepID=A0A5C3EE36_9BASI|nr:uncharacterized protein UTRI_05080 [Ustilago trichophora]